MFTFRPPSKNGNGHKKGSSSHSDGNGHNGNGWLGVAFKTANGHTAGISTGNGNSRRMESVLGPGIHFKGALTGAGGARIEGTFDGSIDIQGPLIIAEGAKVTSDVRASAVTIAGSLKGNITAGKVEILSTGRVWGDLVATAFATEEGAFLRGQVRMEDQLPQAEAKPAEMSVA